ncbi:TPMT family class I SAM-dependent methyltransferase [Geothrix fuzhouensis]|uniref:TPMT family class I SAM-dependent methyltransferase n=1 Tax=Geothrix fuzhouensis TaxID=2966451 RepID=UPI0021486A45|nr:TPMT family class I SAM-dependent methyltransferase [Geothrix fuzhouensis]
MTDHPNYWNALYEDDARPGWDMAKPTPVLAEALAHAAAAGLAPGASVVVPGCGYGHDAAGLEAEGFAVTGLDFAPLALQGARARYGDRIIWSSADWLSPQLGPSGPVPAPPCAATTSAGMLRKEGPAGQRGSLFKGPDVAERPSGVVPLGWGGGRHPAASSSDHLEPLCSPRLPCGPPPGAPSAARGGAGTGPWDAIFDHTCFVAMDPERRRDYVEACARHLRPGGLWMAVIFDDVQGRPGPPHAIPLETCRELADPHFEILHLARASASHPRRAGRELLMVARRRQD